MATPTISNVNPATGLSAGKHLVTITGTNFRVPTASYTNPTTPVTPTVRVVIGGRTAPQVDVLSSTELRVLMPRLWHISPATDAFSPRDVVVSNLDDDGDVIVGETVTASSAYTYERWTLGAPRRDPALYKIGRELIWSLKLEVERNTHRATHVEYAESGSTEVRIDLAKLPSINLSIDTPRDIEYSQWDNYPEEITRGDGTIARYWGARTHRLDIKAYLTGGGSREASFMTDAVLQFVQVNPLLTVPADEDLYPDEEDEYFIEITRDPVHIGSPNDSSVVSYAVDLSVRGIAVLPDEPTEIVKPIQDFVLAISDFAVTAPVEMDI